jgi:hypothetical protein
MSRAHQAIVHPLRESWQVIPDDDPKRRRWPEGCSQPRKLDIGTSRRQGSRHGIQALRSQAYFAAGGWTAEVFNQKRLTGF